LGTVGARAVQGDLEQGARASRCRVGSAGENLDEDRSEQHVDERLEVEVRTQLPRGVRGVQAGGQVLASSLARVCAGCLRVAQPRGTGDSDS
jgi:hypothetical protein